MGKQRVATLDDTNWPGEVIESIDQGDEVIIERAGKPVAAVISAERYEAMERSRERLFAMIDEVHERNREVPPKVIEDEVDKALRETRAGPAS